MSITLGKYFGCIMIVVGTAVGAGMLALPLVGAPSGFFGASALLLGITLLMTVTGLLVLEVNLAFPEYSNSLSSMASATIGKKSKLVVWLAYLLFLYGVICAYIAGNSSLLTNLLATCCHLKIPQWLNALLYVLVFGSVVYRSTYAVDYLNRFLVSGKGILLVCILILLMPHVKVDNLIHSTSHLKYLWMAAPIFLCAVTFHLVIPSLTNYVGRKTKELKLIIILGVLVITSIYVFWLIASLGVLPLVGAESYTTIVQQHGSVGEFISMVSMVINMKWVKVGIDAFANITMTTSFLGVGLGLFDFLADGLKRPNTRLGRLQTALLTFIPPLIFVIFYPNGFVLALGYSAIFVAFLFIILPVIMVYKLRRSKTLKSLYRVFGGNVLLAIVMLAGIGIIVIQILMSFNLLPVF